MLGKRRRTTTENTASAGFSPTWYASAALMVAVILALVGLLIYIGVRPHSPTPAAAPPAAAPTNPGGVGPNPGAPPPPPPNHPPPPHPPPHPPHHSNRPHPPRGMPHHRHRPNHPHRTTIRCELGPDQGGGGSVVSDGRADAAWCRGGGLLLREDPARRGPRGVKPGTRNGNRRRHSASWRGALHRSERVQRRGGGAERFIAHPDRCSAGRVPGDLLHRRPGQRRTGIQHG